MDCRDFLRLAEASRRGDLSRYGWALLDWHRRSCRRCAAAMARATSPRSAPPARERAPLHARTA